MALERHDSVIPIFYKLHEPDRMTRKCFENVPFMSRPSTKQTQWTRHYRVTVKWANNTMQAQARGLGCVINKRALVENVTSIQE